MSPNPATFTKAIEFPEQTKAEKFWFKVRLYTGLEYLLNKWTIFSQRVARSWAYAKFGWDNYDFDSAYALELLHFKLLRLQRALETGYSRQEKDATQSLRLAIRLLQRLVDDNYSYFYGRHNLKWHGEKHPEFSFEKTSSGLSRMVSPREQLPEDQQEKASAELSAAFDADDNMKARDRRWLFSILDKYYAHWWD